MSDTNCHREMRGFHADSVTLSNKQQNKMRDRRDNARIRLKAGLNDDGYSLPKEFSSQGSYAMRTMVQDPDCDYDIDDGVYFDVDALKKSDNEDISPLDARKRVKSSLRDERLTYKAVVKTNCVRQNYPEGYHIDIPVYRINQFIDSWGNNIKTFELASGDEWVESDARAVTKWFTDEVGAELKSGESDTSQLRRLTKLTKKFARSRIQWKNKTTSGICITKLIVDHFVPQKYRDDLALRKTWNEINLNLKLDSTVRHPTQSDKNLADSGDDGVAFFQDCLNNGLSNLDILEDDCSHEKACKAWDKVFNTTYFSNNSYGKGNDSKSLLSSATHISAGLSFPDKPVIPNKPAGFA